MPLHTSVPVLLALGLALASSPAAGLPLTLHWNAPSGCPTTGQLEEQVSRLLGDRVPTGAALVVDAQVSRGEGWWAAHLTTSAPGNHEQRGERVVQAPTCEELGQATALIIALAMCPECVPLTTPSAPQGTPVQAFLRVETTGDLGLLPQPGLGVGVAGAVSFGKARVEVRFFRGFPQHLERGPRPGTGVDLEVPYAVGARGCWTPLEGRVFLGACLGADGVGVRGRGVGISDPATANGWWVGLAAAALAGVRLFERVAVTAEFSIARGLTRPVFVLDGFGVMHATSQWVGRLGAGVEVRFW